MEVDEAPLRGGATELPELDDDVSAVIVQQPNFLGAVEDLTALADAAQEAGALTIAACDPLPLALLKPPGECGVDIAVGEGQTLGNRLDFGGPSFGFFAATEALMRRMPGRIAGETKDVDGKRGFVLTLQTREQHIRREKATSNICTAQALNALAGVIYLSWLGRRGIVELAELMLQRTAYARERLTAIDGVTALHDRPVVREFAVELEAPVERVIARCREQGVNPGYPLGRDYPEHENGLLVAITERRTRADIDRLADALGAAVAAERAGGRSEGAGMIREADDKLTIYERSRAGRRAFTPPELDVPERPLDELLPRGLRRAEPPRLPEVSEPEIVRHYNRLSKRNFDLDTGFYPLGSCTMKHNPKLHERVAGAARPRPAAPAPGPPLRPGRARADVAPAGRARRDRRAAARVAPAVGRLAGRARRRAADARAPRGPRRAPDQGADARHRARHQPGDGDDGRLRGGQGRSATRTATSTSTTCAPRPTRTSPA